jgi:DNA topoisomerase-1
MQTAGLVYVNDTLPGIRRLRRGKGFSYRHVDGHRLTDVDHLARIRALAIPPAYTDVWICPMPSGHLQATGRDARGRKQFRYHPAWTRARDEHKFDRLPAFAAALPRIRARVRRDLSGPIGRAVPREAVIAAVVRLLDTTLVRVGNDEYAQTNGSFGLTTLRNQHAAVRGSALRFSFRGKSGVEHEISVQDKRVARIVARCQALPGQQLFEYLDDAGTARGISSSDVNDYLREASGGEFTAKDFRTWHGSVAALDLWRRQASGGAPSGSSAQRANAILKQVAQRLGNTVAVCRKSYVHPDVLRLLGGDAPTTNEPAPRKAGLSVAERELLRLLSPRRVARKKAAQA